MTDEERVEPVFRDLLFRQKHKHGNYREVAAPKLEAEVVDTHTHLQLLSDPSLALARCAAHGVSFVCTIADTAEDGSTTFDQLESWQLEAATTLKQLSGEGSSDPLPPAPHVRIITGCHPHNAKDYDDKLEAELLSRLADPRVAALGEIGLDFHYDFSPRPDQREVFRRQVRIAKECGLPVVLHVREAHEEALALMRDEGFPEEGTLLHCFNLDWNTLEPWVAEGCYVAFGGPLTFKHADEVRDAASRVPMNRLLTETDAPFMTPEPMRGMTCGPEHVIFTAERMAEVRGCAPGAERQAFLEHLMENARDLLDHPETLRQIGRG